MNSADYRERWSRSHGGVPARGVVGGWLRIVHRAAQPFVALGVTPNAVTGLGLLVAVATLAPAAAGGRWALAAVPVVVLSGLLDSVDGAVAVITGQAGRLGAVLDPACDRLADLCFVGSLWLVGSSAATGARSGWLTGLGLAGAVLALIHEQVRASARAAGMTEVGVVTVSERPTRVIVTAAFLLAAGLYPAAAPTWAVLGALAWAVLGAIGLVQLSVVVVRTLGRPN